MAFLFQAVPRGTAAGNTSKMYFKNQILFDKSTLTWKVENLDGNEIFFLINVTNTCNIIIKHTNFYLFYFIFSYILSLFFLGNTKRRVDQFENM